MGGTIMPDIAVEEEDKSQWFFIQTSHWEKKKSEKEMEKNTHTPLCSLTISHNCALIFPEMSFRIKKYMYFIKILIYQPVYVSLTEQKILNIPPNLILILKHNWEVTYFEYRWESCSPKLAKQWEFSVSLSPTTSSLSTYKMKNWSIPAASTSYKTPWLFSCC